MTLTANTQKLIKRGKYNNLVSFFKETGPSFANGKVTAITIVLLGWLHVLIYALVMPPWGLLDESQHFHYVQFVAEEHRLPIMWKDQLSEEIMDSIFAVKRYITLGGNTMPDRNEVMQPGRLDSESYEAHHPPLYYAILALIYPLGPTDALGKLFFLRFVNTILSCFTLGIIWKSTRTLWPRQIWIANAATLFIALHPERSVSIAQLNNDAMLEITCAFAFGCLALAMARGLSWRLALVVGLSLGLAALTKLSALTITPAFVLGWLIAGVIQRQSWSTILRQELIILVSIAGCLLPIIARNLILYQEPTGLNTFIAHTGPFTKGSIAELAAIGVVDLFRNSWAILWDGVRVVSKPSAALMQLALVLEISGLGFVIGRAWSRQDEALTPLARGVIVIGCAAIILTGLSVLFGYVRGLIPVVQGRFLLPVLVPTAWLIGFSLWLVGARWRGLMAMLLFLFEVILGMSVLFFHSLPKFYAPRDTGFLGYWPQTVYLFSPAGLFWDKPNFVNPWTVGLTLLAFGSCLVVVRFLLIKQFGTPIHPDQWRTVISFIKAQTLAPHISYPDEKNGVKVNWMTRFLQAGQDPLLWTAGGLLVIYLGWVSLYPVNIFWSLDEGGKYIYLQSIIASGNPATPLLYPGHYLDQHLRFVPLHFWSRQGDQIFSWWPIGFPFITAPFYLIFGWFGLYLLPALAGATSALLTGLLVRHLQPQRTWLAILAVIITGLATPVAFYSTLFWEHTLSVACFLGGVWSILRGWKTGRYRQIVAAGILFALATYLRTDIAAMAAGIGLVLLVLYWRWSILLGVSYIFACLPWLFLNWLLMGHLLSSYWDPGTAGFSTLPLFLGFQDAGIWFIPYTLFNAPRIAAFPLGYGTLILATLLTLIALIAPLLHRLEWIALMSYAGLSFICGWVLFQTDGYRSVHGFILIAPHGIFAAWLYRSRSTWSGKLLPLLLPGIVIAYTISYLIRGWVAAGGLQWGPRYLLVFYPLLVITSLAGLAAAWPSLRQVTRLGLLAFYLLCVLIGFGYQARGVYAALETKRYYQQTEQTIQHLDTETIVSSCPWLGMVIPDLYWTGSLFTINREGTFEEWVAEARRVGTHSVCKVEMDLCQLTLLDNIKTQRATNPGGIEAQCFRE